MNLFGNDRDDEKPHDDHTVKKRALPNLLETQSRCSFWIKLSRAQDQGLQFWQTKSFAIITFATVPGDCIDRVTSQNGDRVIFERLATAKPAPKVTLKSNWLTQQQQQQPQQPTLEEGVSSSWKQHATWERRAGVDDTKNATAVDIVSRKLVRDVSTVDVVLISVNRKSSHEANTQEIERVKIGSNKICIHEDPAEEKMVFSNESSRAVFEMGNVELI